MAINAGEQSSGGEVRDNDGRLIVVGPGGVAIGGGGAGSDPLSDGTPGGALPTKTLWVAGADGAVLRGITVNASGHQLVAVQNFPATQAVSDGGGSLTVDGTVTANAGTGPWPVTDNGGTLSVDDGAGSLTVDGSVSVSNFPGSQPVTGPLTDTQLRASAVPTSLASLPALSAGAAVIGKVDINSAPQVAVNNVETLTDNAAFTDGTSKVFMSGGVFDEVAGTALTENDAAASRINANRAVVTVTEDGITRGRYATVKAASTAAAATDPAQVVSLSPNSPLPRNPGTVGGQTSVAATTTANTTLIAADATRFGLTIFNESASATLFVLMGAGTQSATVYTAQLPPNWLWEVPDAMVTLRASGNWSAAVGSARITAVT